MTARDDDDLEGFDGLRAMIGAARASGFDEEPAPRIDALLMTAARQHAPRPRAAWWARLADWMRPVFAHPALAGAAALVIVGGAAGVMYRRGQRTVQPTVQVRPVELQTTTAPPRDQVTPDPEAPRVPSLGSNAVPDEVLQPELPKPQVERRRPSVATRTAGSGEAVRKPGDGTDGAKGAGLMIAEGPPGEILEESNQNQQDLAFASELGTEAEGDQDDIGTVRLGAQHGRTSVDTTRSLDIGGAPPATRPDQAPAREQPGDATIASADRGSRDQARTSAVQLLGQARTAARANNCAVVKVMATRVRKLDAAYFRDVFARDPDIARCL